MVHKKQMPALNPTAMGQESQGSDSKEQPVLCNEGAEETVQELVRETGTEAAVSSGL